MKNVKIGTRLGMGFGLIILMMVIIAALGINRLRANAESMATIVNVTYGKISLINEAARTSELSARSLRNAMLARNTNESEKFVNIIAESSKKVSTLNDRLLQLITLPEERALFERMEEGRAKYSAVRRALLILVGSAKKDEATNMLFNEVLPIYAEYTSSIDHMIDYERNLMSRDSDQANRQAQSAQLVMIGVFAVITALTILLAIFLTRSIVRPINDAVNIANTVASGDLSSRIEIKTKDETGLLLGALKKMNENLVQIVLEVRTGTDTIGTASSEIAAGNMDLSSRTEQQASSLEETAASMEELTSTTKQNAGNARQANQLAESASALAVKGGGVVAQVVDTMEAINDSAKTIVDIISVIDAIAFQTNILALNAAVEAARAGEQGRGFAVVATEVRNLAQRSATAAKEIKILIGESVERVDAGTKLVALAGSTMGQIVDSVERVTNMMAEISAASQEQNAGIEQVNQAIGQMDQVTQQNAALVEEAAAAAQSLQDQSSRLALAVSVFRLDGNSIAGMPELQTRAFSQAQGKQTRLLTSALT